MSPAAAPEAADWQDRVRANIFPPAHDAIGDWDNFAWHCDQWGRVQAHKPHSSQALAIDVFGAVCTAPRRGTILDALAERVGMAPGGPWTLRLEWTDPARLLREPRPTQVDAIAFGRNATLVIECKFTEPGGTCSQPRKLTSGPGAGLRQCDGSYRVQVNPANGREARCALSGKGIRYWEVIPAIFALDAGADHFPCPFRGEAFQWMRNLALAQEIARVSGKPAALLVAYAAGGAFPTEDKAGRSDWLPKLRNEAMAPHLISYQDIAAAAAAIDPDPRWPELSARIARKVNAARGSLRRWFLPRNRFQLSNRLKTWRCSRRRAILSVR